MDIYIHNNTSIAIVDHKNGSILVEIRSYNTDRLWRYNNLLGLI